MFVNGVLDISYLAKGGQLGTKKVAGQLISTFPEIRHFPELNL